jgi:ketosteroid isomerase-like protein
MSDSFDTMAIAVDWLDAYRAGDLNALLNLYDDEACLECGCGGRTILVGKAGLKEYWAERLVRQAALELEDLQPDGDGVALAYNTSEGLVRAVFSFNETGKIARCRCGPPGETQLPRSQ